MLKQIFNAAAARCRSLPRGCAQHACKKKNAKSFCRHADGSGQISILPSRMVLEFWRASFFKALPDDDYYRLCKCVKVGGVRKWRGLSFHAVYKKDMSRSREFLFSLFRVFTFKGLMVEIYRAVLWRIENVQHQAPTTDIKIKTCCREGASIGISNKTGDFPQEKCNSLPEFNLF